MQMSVIQPANFAQHLYTRRPSCKQTVRYLRCRARRAATVCVLEGCKQVSILYWSRQWYGRPWGATQAVCNRVRLHDDFFICIVRSGKYYVGGIDITFQDATGSPISYGEWQERRETPVIPECLRGVCPSGPLCRSRLSFLEVYV